MGFRIFKQFRPWLNGAILLFGVALGTCALAEATTRAGTYHVVSQTETQNAQNTPNHSTLVNQASSAYENSFSPITSAKTPQDFVRANNESDFTAVNATKMASAELKVPKEIQAIEEGLTTTHIFSVLLSPETLQQSNKALKISNSTGTEVATNDLKPFADLSQRKLSSTEQIIENGPSSFIQNVGIETKRALMNGNTFYDKADPSRKQLGDINNDLTKSWSAVTGPQSSQLTVEDASHVQVKEVMHRNDFASAYRRRMMTEEEYASYFNWISDSEIEELHAKIVSEQKGKNPETQLTENDKRTANWSNLATDAIAKRSQNRQNNGSSLSISRDPRQERNLSIVLGITNHQSSPQPNDAGLYQTKVTNSGYDAYTNRTGYPNRDFYATPNAHQSSNQANLDKLSGKSSSAPARNSKSAQTASMDLSNSADNVNTLTKANTLANANTLVNAHLTGEPELPASSNQDYLSNLAKVTQEAQANEQAKANARDQAQKRDINQVSNQDLSIDLQIADNDTHELNSKSLMIDSPFDKNSIENNVSTQAKNESQNLSHYLDQVMLGDNANGSDSGLGSEKTPNTTNTSTSMGDDNGADNDESNKVSAIFTTSNPQVIEDTASKNGYLPFNIDSHLEQNNVIFDITIEGNSYIYQHSLMIEGNSSISFGMPELPTSQIHEDMQGSAQVYFKHLTLTVPINSCQVGDILTLNYQGCDEHGICYPPQSYKVAMPNAISQTAQDSDLVSMINNSVHLISDSHEEGIAEILKHNLLLGLLVCFVLGIGLDLTPCVLPMLPIFSTMLIGAHSNKVKVKDDIEVEADKIEAEFKRHEAKKAEAEKARAERIQSELDQEKQSQDKAAQAKQTPDKQAQDKVSAKQACAEGSEKTQDKAKQDKAQADEAKTVQAEAPKVKKNRFKDHEFKVVLLQNIGYSIGLSFTYMVLGLLFASLGASLHNILQSPTVIICIALLLCACALSCAGVIEMRMPSFITNKLQAKINTIQTGSFPGAVLFGMLSALIASPCTSAPLAGALLYIFTTGNMLVGALYFWAIGLGMAFPLFIIGVFGSKVLLKSKVLGDVIKRLLVVILLITAYMMISRLMGEFDLILRTLLIYIVCVYVFTSMLALLLRHNLQMSKVITIAFLCLLPSYLAYNYFEKSGITVHYEFFTQVHSNNEIERYSRDKYTFIVFTAEWCTNCKQMEEQVYSSDRFMLSSTDLNKLVVDITNTQDGQTAEIIKKYKLVGVPCYVILDPAGNVVEQRLGLQTRDTVINSIHKLHYQQQYAL